VKLQKVRRRDEIEKNSGKLSKCKGQTAAAKVRSRLRERGAISGRAAGGGIRGGRLCVRDGKNVKGTMSWNQGWWVAGTIWQAR